MLTPSYGVGTLEGMVLEMKGVVSLRLEMGDWPQGQCVCVCVCVHLLIVLFD